MDLDAATKEAPILHWILLRRQTQRVVEEEAGGVGGRAGGSRDGTDTGRAETGG